MDVINLDKIAVMFNSLAQSTRLFELATGQLRSDKNLSLATNQPTIHMAHEIFNALVTTIDEELLRRVNRKGVEYSQGGDRFSNFHLQASLHDLGPVAAMQNNLDKHLAAVLGIVRYGENFNEQIIMEKFGDMIVYLKIMMIYLLALTDAKIELETK